MILINKGQTNNVVLTLSERTTIVGATYLFDFENDNTHDHKYFIAADIGVNKERADEFEIIENATENLLNGVVSLAVGTYKYTVYEQASTTNLDPALAGGIVEIGRVEVITNEAADTIYQSPNTSIEYNG